MDDPLARLATALESLSGSQLRLAEAADHLARVADAVPRERLTGAADRSRRSARQTAAAAARVSDAPRPARG